MVLKRAASALLALSVVACAHAEPHPGSVPREPLAHERESSRRQVAEQARRLELLLSGAGLEAAPAAPFRFVGADDGPVPAFTLTTPDGWRYDSQALVGEQPFVLVFFATWCEYCSGELRVLESALAEVEPMLVIPVSADDAATWHRVPGYLASHGIVQPAVRARDYPFFSVAYNPSDTVPVVVIVGRRGALVDYHVGYEPAHAARLVTSLRLAQRRPSSAEQAGMAE